VTFCKCLEGPGPSVSVMSEVGRDPCEVCEHLLSLSSGRDREDGLPFFHSGMWAMMAVEPADPLSWRSPALHLRPALPKSHCSGSP
jgi:hypothetical protein